MVEIVEINNRELLEFSLKIEQEGQAFYKELSNHISDPEVRKFLLFMSGDEARHENQFKKILGEKKDRKYGWEDKPALRQLIDKGFKGSLFPDLDEILEHLPRFEGIHHALTFALKSEELSVEFFSTLREYCDDFETQILMVELENEKKAHRDYILNLIDDLGERI